jgi:hypothetical protein
MATTEGAGQNTRPATIQYLHTVGIWRGANVLASATDADLNAAVLQAYGDFRANCGASSNPKGRFFHGNDGNLDVRA